MTAWLIEFDRLEDPRGPLGSEGSPDRTRESRRLDHHEHDVEPDERRLRQVTGEDTEGIAGVFSDTRERDLPRLPLVQADGRRQDPGRITPRVIDEPGGALLVFRHVLPDLLRVGEGHPGDHRRDETESQSDDHQRDARPHESPQPGVQRPEGIAEEHRDQDGPEEAPQRLEEVEPRRRGDQPDRQSPQQGPVPGLLGRIAIRRRGLRRDLPSIPFYLACLVHASDTSKTRAPHRCRLGANESGSLS